MRFIRFFYHNVTIISFLTVFSLAVFAMQACQIDPCVPDECGCANDDWNLNEDGYCCNSSGVCTLSDGGPIPTDEEENEEEVPDDDPVIPAYICECEQRPEDLDADCLPDALEPNFRDAFGIGTGTDPNNPDTDGDGILDGCEDGYGMLTDGETNFIDENLNGVIDPEEIKMGFLSETDPLNPDSDGDGIPDGVEDANHNGVYPNKYATGQFNDANETDPRLVDTDGDGLSDGVEDANHNGKLDFNDIDGDGRIDLGIEDRNCNGVLDIVDGVNEDLDGDGHLDNQNELIGETDPRLIDTDGDGIPDNVEDANHNGVCDSDGNPRETCAWDADMDDDCLLDGVELKYDSVKNPDIIYNNPNSTAVAERWRETDPFNPDSDGDCGDCPDISTCRLLDGIEDYNSNGTVEVDDDDPSKSETDPTRADSDGDGIRDGKEDLNCNGIRDANESDPRLIDTDEDSLDDYLEDLDRDGICDSTDVDIDDDGELETVYMETCAYLRDTDGDGIMDGAEDFNHDGLKTVGETDPRLADTDGDGLDDGEEQTRSTNPLSIDTDDDLLTDGCEVNFSPSPTSPLDPDTDGDGLDDGEEDANHNCQVDDNETSPLVANEAPTDPIPVVYGQCELDDDCTGTGQVCLAKIEDGDCTGEKCCYEFQLPRYLVCSTSNLKPLDYAAYSGHSDIIGRPLGDDFSLAFEMEVDPNQPDVEPSPYFKSAFGMDATGDNVFSASNFNDTFMGYTFQSPLSPSTDNGYPLNRDVYGFIMVYNHNTVLDEYRTLTQMQTWLQQKFDIYYSIENQVLGGADDAHDDSPRFRVRKVSDKYDICSNTSCSAAQTKSAIDFRNDIIHRLLPETIYDRVQGIEENDKTYIAGANLYYKWRVRTEIVQRPNDYYLIVVALTPDDQDLEDGRTASQRESHFLDRDIRLEDLTQGSAVARHDATVSKQCIMQDRALARADMLFVVDDSGSMQQVIQAAIQASEDVESVLAASRDFFDFRIAMTTSNRTGKFGKPYDAFPDAYTDYDYPGGGGNFYWEYNTGAVFPGNRGPELRDNEGFFGYEEENCDGMSWINVSRDGGGIPYEFSDIDDCDIADETILCQRLTQACKNGLTNFRSQICDLIYAMTGMCGQLGRYWSGSEHGARSTMRFINKVIPARKTGPNYVGNADDKLFLRHWCDDPNDPSCLSQCDARPKAVKQSDTACFVDSDCYTGERCLLSYGDSAGNECHSTNGKCCYEVQTCNATDDATCGTNQVCRTGSSCETIKIADSEGCQSNAACNLAHPSTGTLVCQPGDDCEGDTCCYQNTCCYDDCDMVPLLTVFLSDEEDAYFKDDCRLWDNQTTYNYDYSFDFEQLPSECVGNGVEGCTVEYCTQGPDTFYTQWPVNHDAQMEKFSIDYTATSGYWFDQYTEQCGDLTLATPTAPDWSHYDYNSNYDQPPMCRAEYYYNASYPGASPPTSYSSDCAACKRFLRTQELLEFFKSYGRMYAITRNEGKAGITRDCGEGSASRDRGDGKAYRDLASQSGGKFTDVCLFDNEGGYQVFLQQVIADAQAASKPYPLIGNPIAATIKVGIYGPDRAQFVGREDIVCEEFSSSDNNEWGICYPNRSRTNGFNYDPDFNTLTFHTTPRDANSDGSIDSSEIDDARESPNLPRAGEVVLISYRYWVNVPCNDSCERNEFCVQEDCTEGEEIPTGSICINGLCREGEECNLNNECVVICGDSQVDYCKCSPNCGNRCGACEQCLPSVDNPDCGECVAINDLCACNPDPQAQTCDPNDPLNTCGAGLCCDESCVCTTCQSTSTDCLSVIVDYNTKQVTDCRLLEACCEEWDADTDIGNECCASNQNLVCVENSESNESFYTCEAQCTCSGCDPITEWCNTSNGCTCEPKGP